MTPGSASRAATRPGSWRPRWRRCAAARATSPGSPRLVARGGGGRGRRRAAALAVGRGGPGRRRRRGRSPRGWPARVAPVPVRLLDERLTTVSAEAMLRDRGRKGAEAAGRGRPGSGRADPAARPGHRAGDRTSTGRDRRGETATGEHERRRRRRRRTRSDLRPTTSRRAPTTTSPIGRGYDPYYLGGARKAKKARLLGLPGRAGRARGGRRRRLLRRDQGRSTYLKDQFSHPADYAGPGHGKVMFEVNEGDSTAADRSQPQGRRRGGLGRRVHRRRARRPEAPASRSATTSSRRR